MPSEEKLAYQEHKAQTTILEWLLKQPGACSAILWSWRSACFRSASASTCLMGTVSGSAVANVVTTGTFTIPLMKSIGYRPAHYPDLVPAADFLLSAYPGSEAPGARRRCFEGRDFQG